jgi:iron uptake system component EfeO
MPATPVNLRRFQAAAGAAALVAVFAAGCGGGSSEDGSGSGGSGARKVAVTLTDAGCDPAKLALPAGPATFEVENDDAEKVSEFEILGDNGVLGEVEHITPGKDGSFSLTLQGGTYRTLCPGGTTASTGSLVVTGKTTAPAGGPAARAVSTYRRFLEAQTAELVPATTKFAAAVRAGDVAEAKRLYPAARIPYERIEPVAESFGSLDPAIDARAGDVPKVEWTGFHPIEQALWVRGTTAGQEGNARKLVADVKRLRAKVARVELEPAQIANGAVELLGEVSKSKITGEEERYSHIDLDDFDGNLAGAKAAYEAVAPLLEGTDTDLAADVKRQFRNVEASLGKYRKGDTYVSYTSLTKADTRGLSQAVDALAEPLSQVAGRIVG